MENVVPVVLQRLRAADIIRMAGLSVAALGQEYERLGGVRQAQRQDTYLTGVVIVPRLPDVTLEVAATASNPVDGYSSLLAEDHRYQYTPEIILDSLTDWRSTCTCNTSSSALCAHACALLYHWINHPYSFTGLTTQETSVFLPAQQATEALDGTSVLLSSSEQSEQSSIGASLGEERVTDLDAMALAGHPAKPVLSSAFRTPIKPRGPAPLCNLLDVLAQLSLSELRGIAREYEISTNGLSKQQLVEAVYAVLCQPERVRHVALALEKQQRQLMAALTLIGGAITDDDLHSMFERFGLGQPPQLQEALTVLQGKGLLFRASLNNAPQVRIGLSGSLLDVGWFVPLEVRNALRVSVPTTPFDIEQFTETESKPVVRLAEPYRLLSALLLVARALEGYQQEGAEQRDEAGTATSSARGIGSGRSTVPLTSDSSIALPAPDDRPSAAMLSFLQRMIPYSVPLLRFAVRLLRLAGVVYTESASAQSAGYRVLTTAAALLLGSNHAEVTRDLFELWLTEASYEELFELQEDGVRVRCRTTSLRRPLLRAGELEAENSEARQALVALLAQVPINRWCNFAAFARFIYRLNPLFLQRRQRLFPSPHWWLEREEGRALRPLSLSDWMRAEYYYLARLLRGPLYWWGLCDIALNTEGRLVAFRLTSMAEWLLHGDAAGAPLQSAASEAGARFEGFEITGENEILVESSMQTWPIIHLLEDFAARGGVRNGMLCYRLTPQALSQALGRGLRVEALLNLLRTHMADQPALQPLLAQLERWAANYGRVRIYTQVAMLQAADTTVMRELSATTSFDSHVVYPVHATLAILRRSGLEQLIEDLKRRGQTPLLHNED
jgi:hypothetical protein